jgi:hypothetical protein
MNNINLTDLDKFTQGYIICALWSSIDNDGEPLDKNYIISNIAQETMAKMADDCKDFQNANRELLDHCGLELSRQGHDFWLNRNGHGSGFWDEGNDPVFHTLSDICHLWGDYELYIGDDNMIYGS